MASAGRAVRFARGERVPSGYRQHHGLAEHRGPGDQVGIVDGQQGHERLDLAVAQDAVTLDDLARDTVFRAARPAPPYWVEPPQPWTTSAGHPVRRGRPLATFRELLAVIAAGEAVCPLAAHAVEYFAHPRIVFVPFRDAPPVAWALIWRSAGETARVRALARVLRAPARKPSRAVPPDPTIAP